MVESFLDFRDVQDANFPIQLPIPQFSGQVVSVRFLTSQNSRFLS